MPESVGVTSLASSALALNGGAPVRRAQWPKWPMAGAGVLEELNGVLTSGRWTVSGEYTGAVSKEQLFATEFARFVGVDYCVPTCHGSSALVIGLEALDVGPGDEVLVPGLTWVACASAVVRVGATPILVDIDPDTLCMSPESAAAAITDRTKAIMLVHLFCSAADMDAFMNLSERTGVPLMEDCSQAHGAAWRDRRLGSLGRLGVFSFQQTKLMTSGEGGAVVTDSEDLFDRLQQLRADGRRYIQNPKHGRLDLEEVGAVQGHNYCLSEFHATLLSDGLRRLADENALRRQNAVELEVLLERVGGVSLIGRPAGLEQRAFYHVCMRVAPQEYGNASIDDLAAAIGAELGVHAEPVDDPLNDNILYAPERRPGNRAADRKILDPRRFALAHAVAARKTCFTLPHKVLLGGSEEVRDIADAILKVKRAAAGN